MPRKTGALAGGPRPPASGEGSPGVGGLAHAVAHQCVDEQVVVHFGYSLVIKRGFIVLSTLVDSAVTRLLSAWIAVWSGEDRYGSVPDAHLSSVDCPCAHNEVSITTTVNAPMAATSARPP